MPVWFVNGQWDQLRVNERLFTTLVPHAELIVVPRTSHLVTAMRPRVFNAVIDTPRMSRPARSCTAPAASNQFNCVRCPALGFSVRWAPVARPMMSPCTA